MLVPELILMLILWWCIVSSIFVWVIYEREYRATKRNPASDPVCSYGRAEAATAADSRKDSSDVLQRASQAGPEARE